MKQKEIKEVKGIREIKDSFIFKETENIEMNEKEIEKLKKYALAGVGCYLELGEESKFIVAGKERIIDSSYMLYAQNTAINENFYINAIDELINLHAPFKMKLYKGNKIVCKHIPEETIEDYNEYDLIVFLFHAPECYSILISYSLADDKKSMVNFHISDNIDCHLTFIKNCRDFKIFCDEYKQKVLNLQDSTAEDETETDNDDTST